MRSKTKSKKFYASMSAPTKLKLPRDRCSICARPVGPNRAIYLSDLGVTFCPTCHLEKFDSFHHIEELINPEMV